MAPYLIGAMVTLAVIVAAVLLHPIAGRTTAAATAEPSIAVLPFANVSGAREDAPLVDGLTEELTAVLAKLGHSRVIGGSSVLAFKNSDIGASHCRQPRRVEHSRRKFPKN